MGRELDRIKAFFLSGAYPQCNVCQAYKVPTRGLKLRRRDKLELELCNQSLPVARSPTSGPSGLADDIQLQQGLPRDEPVIGQRRKVNRGEAPVDN